MVVVTCTSAVHKSRDTARGRLVGWRAAQQQTARRPRAALSSPHTPSAWLLSCGRCYEKRPTRKRTGLRCWGWAFTRVALLLFCLPPPARPLLTLRCLAERRRSTILACPCYTCLTKPQDGWRLSFGPCEPSKGPCQGREALQKRRAPRLCMLRAGVQPIDPSTPSSTTRLLGRVRRSHDSLPPFNRDLRSLTTP